MEFRLLGPFEVRIDATPQLIAGRGERALLALLALSPGEVVPVTALIDALWATGHLPQDPVNALQLRVSKLRRALSAWGAPDRVHRDGAGYRMAALWLDDGELAEDGAAPGDRADPEAGAALGLDVAHLGAAEVDRSGRVEPEARDDAQQRRLARAVRAEQRHHLAVVDDEVHPEEHLHGTVGEVDVTAGEQR